MRISLESLLQRLVSRGNEVARATPIDQDNRPTSIRLKPSTKHFLEAQASALNTSVQSLISMILDGVSEVSVDNTTGSLRTIKDRFFHVFHAHGLDLPGIVSVMKGHGFTLSVLDQPTRLLDLLDQKAIQFIANTFSIRSEWLSASSDYVIKLGVDVRWYKNVYCMAQRLVQYHHDGLKPHVMFIRREHADFVKARIDDDAGKTDREPVGVIIKLSRCTDDNVKFDTYEVWDFERWNYWRCREQLKLLICFCDQANSIISYSGYELPDEEIKLITSYKLLPVIAVNTIHQVAWYPEDYASLRFKVDKEADDWILVEKEYLNSKLQSLIVD